MKTFVAFAGVALVVLIALIRLFSGLTRRSGPPKARRSRRPSSKRVASARVGAGAEARPVAQARPIAQARAVRRTAASAPTAPVPSAHYAAAAALLHLAVIVCTADDAVSAAERRLLDEHVARAPGLGADERGALRQHLDALLESKPNFRGVKKRLASLDAAQRAAMADVLVGVAGADGQIAPDEIRLLGKIYPMLGLAAEDVYSRVHAMAVGAAPEAPSAASAGRAQPIQLNMAAVQEKLAESAQVSAILGDIFSEQEREREQQERAAASARASAAQAAAAQSAADRGGATAPAAASSAAPPATAVAAPAAPAPASAPAAAGALSAAHGTLLRQLSERAEWSRDEFAAMAGECRLMPDGAFDALNEAAFERAGVPVLEGDDPIQVDQTTAKDLLA